MAARAIELTRLPWAQATAVAPAAAPASRLGFLLVHNACGGGARACATEVAGTRAAVLISTCHTLTELEALATQPLLRCTCLGTPRGHMDDAKASPSRHLAPRPLLVWVIHSVPTALAAHAKYGSWATRLPGARHVLVPSESLPAESEGLAFAAAAAQRATLRELLGREAFPTVAQLAGEGSYLAGEGLHIAGEGSPLAREGPHPPADAMRGAAAALASVNGWPSMGSVECLQGRPLMSIPLLSDDEPDCARCPAPVDELVVAEGVRAILGAAGGTATDPSGGGGEGRGGGSRTCSWRRDSLVVCMLGTGCAVPSKYRAPAAVYLHLFAKGGMLLDAGEGSLGQLHTLLGGRGARAALRALGAIWISHHHADHHLGLCRLLVAAAELRPPTAPPLLVVGPRSIGSFLAAYAALLPSGASVLRYTFESCAAFNQPRSLGRDWLLRRSGLQLTHARCVPVVHCADAWGLVLGHADGWSLAYSGDTRPCDALVAAARGVPPLLHGATFSSLLIPSPPWGHLLIPSRLFDNRPGVTLLIHEATFDDDRPTDAVLKRHSTRSEALSVGARMGAYRTLLTHLSQRYARDTQPFGATTAEHTQDSNMAGSSGSCAVEASMPTSDGRTSLVAFDMMAINLADLEMIPDLTPIMERYFLCEQAHLLAEKEADLAEQYARTQRLERELEAARGRTISGTARPLEREPAPQSAEE